MIVIKIKELLALKEREIGRKILLEEISNDTGISSATLSRLGSPRPYSTNTNILNRLCSYFGCSISDLLEYTPDIIEAKKHLTLKDIISRRRFLDDQLPNLIIDKLPSIGLKLTNFKRNTTKLSPVISAINESNQLMALLIKPILYHTVSFRAIDEILKENPKEILVFTCSSKLPPDLISWNSPKVKYYQTSVIYNDHENKIIDLSIKHLA